MTESKISILVNTCDRFADCWEPFFKLFSIYWPDFKGTLYLNTEYRNYTYENLDIISLKVCQEKNDAHKITWSECLLRALNSIDCNYILYMQEDYFLKAPVKTELAEKYLQMMHEHSEIDCIHLTDQGSPGVISSDFDKLLAVPGNHRDRISCQAAFWKKDVLIEYIRKHESGWNFEWWGSKRASVFKHNFYAVDSSWIKTNSFEIIPYIFTGVIGGKWSKEVVPLFEKHAIKVNYNIRGFYQRKPVGFSKRIVAKLKRGPTELRSRLDLLRLKLKT